MSQSPHPYDATPGFGDSPAGAPQPDAAHLPGTPGPLGRRAAAYLIDAVITSIIAALPALLVPLLGSFALAAMVLPVAWLVVYVLMLGGSGSVGMRMLGLRLVRIDSGAPLGFGRALVRLLIWGLSCAIVIGYFTPLFDRTAHRRGWHDGVSGAVMRAVSRANETAPAAPAWQNAAPVPGPPVPGAPPPQGGFPGQPYAAQPEASGASAWPPRPADPVAHPPQQAPSPQQPAAPGAPYDPAAAYDPAGPAAPPAYGPAAGAPYDPAAPSDPAAASGTGGYGPAAAHDAPARGGYDPAAHDPAAAGPVDGGRAAYGTPTEAPAPQSPAATDVPTAADGRNPAHSQDPAAYPPPAPGWAPDSGPSAGAPPTDSGEGLIAVVPGITKDPAEVRQAAEADAPPAAPANPAEPVVPGTPAPAGDAFPEDTIVTARAAEDDEHDTRLIRTPGAVVFHWDDGTRHTVVSRTLFGRNPAPEDGAVTVAVRDETRSLSKTHFEADVTAEGVWITDRHSTNGVVIARGGERIDVPAGARTRLHPGDALEMGERIVTLGAGT